MTHAGALDVTEFVERGEAALDAAQAHARAHATCCMHMHMHMHMHMLHAHAHAHAHAPTAQRCGNTDPASARTRGDAAHHSDALEYKTVQRDSVDRTPQRSVCAFNSRTQLSHWGRGEARRWSARADTSSHLPISRVGEEVVFALKKARAEVARERERERDGTLEHPRAPERTREHPRAPEARAWLTREHPRVTESARDASVPQGRWTTPSTASSSPPRVPSKRTHDGPRGPEMARDCPR